MIKRQNFLWHSKRLWIGILSYMVLLIFFFFLFSFLFFFFSVYGLGGNHACRRDRTYGVYLFLTNDYWLMIFIKGILCITILVSAWRTITTTY
jgi:ABC-type multidrug transport system permease subunit